MSDINSVFEDYKSLHAARGRDVSGMTLTYREDPCHLSGDCTCTVRVFPVYVLDFGPGTRPYKMRADKALNDLRVSCDTLRFLIDDDKRRAAVKARRGY